MSEPNRRFLGVGELGRRLAVAFVGVALAAIIVSALFSAASLGSDITRLAQRQEDALASAVALTSAAAYQGIGWARADLRPVFTVARQAGAAARIRDAGGRVVGTSPGFGAFPAARQQHRRVVENGRRVGSVTVRFGPRGLGDLAGRFEAERWRARIVAAVIATVIALVVSLIVARLITGPLESMLSAIRARGSGDRSARIARLRGPGVIRELQQAFNWSTEQLDTRERLQRNLVADLAHEVRTPVAILQAGHEAMLDGVTAPTPENLASLRDEVLRLGVMISDLQRLAAAESAALQLHRQSCDLAVIAAEAADSLSTSYTTAGVRLVERLAQARLSCDPERIREVVVNLLTNALKFTPRGGVVTLRTEPAADREVMLEVTDTGIGIPADELEHVTERFYRGHRSSGMAGGSGIGLTIVWELVRAHHGRLRIASPGGNGTNVTITLPAAGAGIG